MPSGSKKHHINDPDVHISWDIFDKLKEKIGTNGIYASERDSNRGHIISVTGVKGGSGRTFVAICLAKKLLQTELPVLVVGIDNNYSNAAKIFSKLQKFGNISFLNINNIGSIENEVSWFAKNGHVVIDLPPIRNPLHLFGLVFSDQIVFSTLPNNEIRMWKRTRDMIEMAKNLDFFQDDDPDDFCDIQIKPCWGIMTCYNSSNSKMRYAFLNYLKNDKILNWIGEFDKNDRFASMLSLGYAPWEKSKTEAAKKWDTMLEPIINYWKMQKK